MHIPGRENCKDKACQRDLGKHEVAVAEEKKKTMV